MLLCASRAQRSPFFRPLRQQERAGLRDAFQQSVAVDGRDLAVAELLQHGGIRRLRAGRKCLPESSYAYENSHLLQAERSAVFGSCNVHGELRSLPDEGSGSTWLG